MRILFVDDDESLQETVSGLLTEAGHEVECASSGGEALQILREHPCRLVITDWEMPEMNGLTLCRSIRAGQSVGYVYVILLTCHSTPEDIVTGLSAGADDFMSKPFHAGELAMRGRAGVALEGGGVWSSSETELEEPIPPGPRCELQPLLAAFLKEPKS